MPQVWVLFIALFLIVVDCESRNDGSEDRYQPASNDLIELSIADSRAH